MVKLSPLDVTMVLSEAGQDGPLAAEALGVLEVAVELLEDDWTALGFV